MKIAYFDAPSGIAGDMTVAALADAARQPDETFAALTEALAHLPVDGYRLGLERVSVGAVAARHFTVDIDQASQHHRDWKTIRAMIEDAAAGLGDGAAARALAIFSRLAEAEAKVHEVPVDRVHFHEVGAVDSIVDIVGAAWLMEHHGLDAVFVSPVPTGSGFVDTSHGRLAIPAPATAELLTGLEVIAGDGKGELVTPTGAAIVAATAKSVRPHLVPHAIGCGAGTMRLDDRANVLRVFVGEADDEDDEALFTIDADIDDMTPEALAFEADRLREAGARDVTLVPVAMKKGRAGFRLTVLADLARLDALAEAVLQRTTTLGVRYRAVRRRVLARRSDVVETAFGRIAVKFAVRPDGTETAMPEFEDVARAAAASGAPFAEVYAAALALAQ